MPMRIALTQVNIIEILGSLVLLCISVFYMRNAAGKVFALSILLYGKEPSWKEMARWIKEAKS
jgi:ABC-2 type transport system permease protein